MALTLRVKDFPIRWDCISVVHSIGDCLHGEGGGVSPAYGLFLAALCCHDFPCEVYASRREHALQWVVVIFV